tara:strand:+ start:3479 stop:4480 length:1002 start_codon:yes stop_codon:yes gene_type:complete
MAIQADAFSPKEFSCWIISDATNAGTSGIHASNMYQLDVDSVGYPSLNVNQALDVRSGAGKTFKNEDFFQDNKMRVVELSLSGTMHNDAGHKLLLQNICNDVSGDIAIPAGGATAAESQIYGSAVTNAASSLTVVIKASDHSDQKSMEFAGLVVTNFALSADNGTEGGRYKFSATLQTGKVPDLAEASTAAGANVYANTTHAFLSSSSGHKVLNKDVIMNSFTCTIDYPVVFTGATSTGYNIVSRGVESAVTVDTQVKWDSETMGFPNSFDAQTASQDGNMFVVTNNNAFGIDLQNGVFTNVAFSEGDIMMLDCSIKSVDDGSDALIAFDVSA